MSSGQGCAWNHERNALPQYGSSARRQTEQNSSFSLNSLFPAEGLQGRSQGHRSSRRGALPACPPLASLKHNTDRLLVNSLMGSSLQQGENSMAKLIQAFAAYGPRVDLMEA